MMAPRQSFRCLGCSERSALDYGCERCRRCPDCCLCAGVKYARSVPPSSRYVPELVAGYIPSGP